MSALALSLVLATKLEVRPKSVMVWEMMTEAEARLKTEETGRMPETTRVFSEPVATAPRFAVLSGK